MCDGSPETVRRLSLDASGVGALDELLASLGHDSDEVVTRAMRVLGSLGAGEEADFDVVVRRVVTVFASDGGDLLERRGSTVVRTLCAELGVPYAGASTVMDLAGPTTLGQLDHHTPYSGASSSIRSFT